MKNILSKFNSSKPSKPKTQVGLDIGSYSVKVCAVKTEGENRELLTYACVPIKDSNIKETIQQALELSKLEVRSVNISTGTQGVVTRQIVFPKMTPSELNNALKFEAEKYIPYKINEVIMDCQILKKDVEPNKMLLLLVAAKKDIIDRRVALMRELNLRIEIIDVDSLCLTNTFNYIVSTEEINKKNFALLNIGNSISSLVIIKEGLPNITRDISIAGKDLTKQIADNLNIDIASAELLKCNPEGRDKELSTVCDSLVNELCSQVRMSFDYFEEQNGVAVDSIYLSGGASRFIGLDKSVESILGIKISHWDNFHNLVLNNSLDREKFLAELVYLNVALGLALR